jgi:gamma-glutamyltranspeptidase/glutathione hydrolase
MGASSFTTRPELVGHYGMVSSTHWLASAAGMRILEQGGNAFDAAVAAGLTLQVVEPHLNGPGGDLPILVRRAGEDSVRTICGQGVAPAAASIEAFRKLDLELVPGTGLLPACVPGAFDAWMTMLRDYGTAGLDEVFEAAIGHAEDGTPVLPQLAATVAGVEGLFKGHWPTSAAVYLDGGPPQAGTMLRNPDLAAAYRRLVSEATAAGGSRERQIEAARDCFYRGFIAEAVDSFLATATIRDSSGRDHRGLLSGHDMATWEATYEDPVGFEYGGRLFCKTGPWGQGPVMLQQLSLLAGFDLGAMGHNSADYVHTVVECAKLALADREAWYGDPDFTEVPLAALLSPDYAAKRRELVGDRASFELRPGDPDGRDPRLASVLTPAAEAEGIGDSTVSSVGDTCHLDVVDRDGNVVSATPSGGWLQSSPVIPGLGFPLGTRGQMFWLEEGLPASLAPRKRPRSTLTPTIALGDDGSALAFGTPGGDQQDQWSLNFLLAHQEFGFNLQSAIDAAQFHTMNTPSSFYPRSREPGRIEVEDRLGAEVIAELRRRGHDVVTAGPWTLGRVCAVSRDPGGILRAAASPRGMQCYAVGR